MRAWSRADVVRTVVLTGGRAACVVVVAAVAWLATTALSNRSRAASGVWLAATLLVALTVTLSRGPLERLADRAAYGPGGDPYAVLSGFVERISETLAVDDVLPYVARAVTQALHSPRGEVRLWLADGKQERQAWPSDAVGGRAVSVVDVPLRHHGQQVGELDVDVNDELADNDRALLGRLAGTAGLALANVRLAYELRHQIAESTNLARELARSRQRLLIADAEQTRRFSVQVNQQVQSRLVEVSTALDQMEGGNGAAVTRAKTEATSALEALREISAGVFPPALQDRGLAAALQIYSLSFDGRVRVVLEGAQRNSLELESAAYFCVTLLLEDSLADGIMDVVVHQSAVALRLHITAALPPGEDTRQLLTDRVAATDGSLTMVGSTPCHIDISWSVPS